MHAKGDLCGKIAQTGKPYRLASRWDNSRSTGFAFAVALEVTVWLGDIAETPIA